MMKLRSCCQATNWPAQYSQISGYPSMAAQKEFQTLCLTPTSKISRNFLGLVSLLPGLWRGLQAQSMRNLRYCRKRHPPLIFLQEALNLGPEVTEVNNMSVRYTYMCFNHLSN